MGSRIRTRERLAPCRFWRAVPSTTRLFPYIIDGLWTNRTPTKQVGTVHATITLRTHKKTRTFTMYSQEEY